MRGRPSPAPCTPCRVAASGSGRNERASARRWRGTSRCPRRKAQRQRRCPQRGGPRAASVEGPGSGRRCWRRRRQSGQAGSQRGRWPREAPSMSLPPRCAAGSFSPRAVVSVAPGSGGGKPLKVSRQAVPAQRPRLADETAVAGMVTEWLAIIRTNLPIDQGRHRAGPSLPGSASRPRPGPAGP